MAMRLMSRMYPPPFICWSKVGCTGHMLGDPQMGDKPKDALQQMM
jgi:hypothetical protein